MPASPQPLRLTLHACAVMALALPSAAPLARADDRTILERPDQVAVRLSAAASSALAPAPGPRAAGASLAVTPSSGALGELAARLGLTLEHEFPLAGGASAGLRVGSAAADRLGRDWLVHLPPGLTP